MSRALIVALRVALLLGAAAALLVAVAIGGGDRAGDGPAARFVCPMHAEVRAAAPGNCPICGMALQPADRPGAPSGRDLPGVADLTAIDNVRKHRIIGLPRRRSLPATIRELRGPAVVGDDGALDAVFYNDQIASFAADERGVFSLGDAPRPTIAVRRRADAAIPVDASTSRVRFRLDAAAPAGAAASPSALSPGQVGWIEIERKARDVLTVPAAAVLPSPEGPYVLVWTGGGRFEKRPIAIGETFVKQGFAVVLAGLHAQDRLVVRAAFFLDADRRLGVDAPGAPSSSPPVAP